MLAGRVGRPHGLDGSFHVVGADPELARDAYWVSGVRREVVRRAGTSEKPILRLEGSTSRDDAPSSRTIVKASAVKDNRRVLVDIVE